MTQLELALPHAEITATSWAPTRELERDEWLEHGRTIARVREATMWWLGDWIGYGDQRGWVTWEELEQATGRETATLRNALWVAAAFSSFPRRRENLSWSHHAEVAGLEAGEADAWLEWAQTKGWTRNELREQLRQRRSLNPPPPPAGRYRCITIDPPWPVEKVVRQARFRQGAALDYPTMPLEQIAALPVDELAADDGCHVYLWTTHRHLPDALAIFAGWGAAYECTLTWLKPTGVAPFSWLYDTEHVLFGRIGSLPLEQLGLRLAIVGGDAKREHSVKPDEFYARVRQASPGPRLAMFERGAREGFTAWGDEVAA